MRALPLLASLFAVVTLSATGCASISGLDELVVGCDGSSCAVDGGGDGASPESSTRDGAPSGDAKVDGNGPTDSAPLPDGCVACGSSTCCDPQSCVQFTCCSPQGAACNGGGCCPMTYCPNGGGVCTACKQQNQPCQNANECCNGQCTLSKCGDN